MRKVIIVLLIMLGLFFFLARANEVQQAADSLQHGDWRWLVVAGAIHLIYVLSIGATMRSLYRLLGLDERLGRLTLLTLAANFVVVVAPSAGWGGIAVYAADAQKRNHSTGRVTTAAVLYLLYDYLATLIVVILGLVVLFRRNQLHGGEIAAATILLLLAVGLASLLYLGTRSGERLGRALAWMGGLVNRLLRPFIRRDYLQLDRAYTFGREAAEGLRLARRVRSKWLIPLALMLTNKVLMMAILLLMFLAFGQPFSAGTIIAGYSIGYLFTIVSPTPAGVGFVETAMTLALNSLRVPLARAALIVLGYRAYTLWLTVLFGMFAVRFVAQPAADQGPPTFPEPGSPPQ
jgi:hypothetical protein